MEALHKDPPLGGASDLGWEVIGPGLASLIHQSIEVDKGKQVE